MIELLGRWQNYEAETQVLGSVFKDPDLIHDLILSPEHFYDTRHKKLYSWMLSIKQAGINIDFVTVAEIAKERISEVGGVAYITELIGSVPSTAPIKHYEKIVIDNWKEREKIRIYQYALENQGEEGLDEEVRRKIDLIESTGQPIKRFSMSEHLIDKYRRMEEMQSGYAGAPTGLHDFDTLLEGVEKKKLIIIGARPSMGKSAFAINVGLGAIEKGLEPQAKEEVFLNLFSLEMPEDQITNRMISNVGNIEGTKVKNPKEYFSDEDWRKYSLSLGQLNKYEENIDICDQSTITVKEIRARVRENMKEYPDKHHIVIIDYLQLIKGSGTYKGDRQQEVSEISRELKNMANDMNITVIALSQLSRGVELRQDKRPMMSDIRESGAIEQDADIIGFLYREDYYDKESENRNIIEIIIAKNREGNIGTVQLAFLKEYSKFVNLERKYSEAS